MVSIFFDCNCNLCSMVVSCLDWTPIVLLNVMSCIAEEMKVRLQLYDGRPLSASVPKRVTCTIKETQAPMKGITSTPRYVFHLINAHYILNYIDVYVILTCLCLRIFSEKCCLIKFLHELVPVILVMIDMYLISCWKDYDKYLNNSTCYTFMGCPVNMHYKGHV